MWFLGIVPDQVIHQSAVEGVRFVQSGVPVSKLLLYGPVEAFHVTVGLGMAGVVEVVRQVLLAASL